MRGIAGTLAAGIVATLGIAGAAAAGTVTWPDGKTEKLVEGVEIKGPATVTTETEGTIRLRSGSTLRYLGFTSGELREVREGVTGKLLVESVFLKHGIADVDIDFCTRIATPAFWLFPEKSGGRVQATVASIDRSSAHARLKGTSGKARLFVAAVGKVPMEAQLLPGQGMTLARGNDGRLRFRTDADNAWTPQIARVIYPVEDGRLLDVYVPKATEGTIDLLPGDAPRVIRVESIGGSWPAAPCVVHLTSKDGKIAEAQLRGGQFVKSAGAVLEIGDQDPSPFNNCPSTVAREDSNRGRRPGTRLLEGQLEVVEMRADLTAEKPSITFVVERVAGGSPGPLPKDLRWSLEFGEPGHMWHMGEKYPVPEGLDAPGDRVTLTLDMGNSVPESAGRWPDLLITR